MKTDDFIAMLASGTEPVDLRANARRYAVAVASSVAGAAALMMLFLGINPALSGEIALPMFWVKVLFAAVVAVISIMAAVRLSRPGASLAGLPSALAAPLIAIWILAAIVLMNAQPSERADLILGETWRVCPFLIATLSIPGFFASLWAMRGLAPTRLRLAGAAAGLLAGALATLVYTLHCPELAAPFVGTWYLIGMLIPTTVGALIGPRVLRW